MNPTGVDDTWPGWTIFQQYTYINSSKSIHICKSKRACKTTRVIKVTEWKATKC